MHDTALTWPELPGAPPPSSPAVHGAQQFGPGAQQFDHVFQ